MGVVGMVLMVDWAMMLVTGKFLKKRAVPCGYLRYCLSPRETTYVS